MTYLPRLAKEGCATDAALIVICGVCQAAAAAFAAFATRDAFAALHAGQGIATGTLIELAAAGIFGAIALYHAQRRSEALGQTYANALRQCLYRKIATLPKERHDERRLGALSLRFVGDLSAARLWFGVGLPDVLTAAIVLPGAMIILFALDPSLAPAGVIPIALALTIAVALAWHLGKRHRTLRRRRAAIAISMIERISMAPELDQMGRTKKELRSLSDQGQTLRQNAVARRSRAASLQAILQAGTAIAALCLMWRAGQIGTAAGTVAASLAVLALIMLPLQRLATAWDRFCAWRVAKEKAEDLLRERSVERKSRHRKSAVEVTVSGKLGDQSSEILFPCGAITTMTGAMGSRLARHIAGLDETPDLEVRFDGSTKQPRTAYIDDIHTGLQGSLRRTATLLSRKRPEDAAIAEALAAYGLAQLMDGPKGLETRIAEAGRNLSPEETLRLDLVRAELGQVDLLIIDSTRFRAMSNGTKLLKLFTNRNEVTLIVVGPEPKDAPAVYQRDPQT